MTKADSAPVTYTESKSSTGANSYNKLVQALLPFYDFPFSILDEKNQTALKIVNKI